MGQICPDKVSEIYQYMRIGDKAEELSLICQPKKKAETTEAPKGAIWKRKEEALNVKWKIWSPRFHLSEA